MVLLDKPKLPFVPIMYLFCGQVLKNLLHNYHNVEENPDRMAYAN